MGSFQVPWRYGLVLMVLIWGLTGCGQQPESKPDLSHLQTQIQKRFNQAYQGLAEISDLQLTPVDSQLNTPDHQVYDVKLSAVVTEDLPARLKQLPDTMENKILRSRIKGMMQLGAVHQGEKITAHLRALVERDPKTGTWNVVGLIRHTQKKGEEHAIVR